METKFLKDLWPDLLIVPALWILIILLCSSGTEESFSRGPTRDVPEIAWEASDFLDCFQGVDRPYPTSRVCLKMDMDRDGDVDLQDWSRWLSLTRE